ncbi:hypothetical protein M2428_000482 [Arthrobacter sp. ES3-54]|nr:hypothetical protein [Arthrobacter sp. ES3-54]
MAGTVILLAAVLVCLFDGQSQWIGAGAAILAVYSAYKWGRIAVQPTAHERPTRP